MPQPWSLETPSPTPGGQTAPAPHWVFERLTEPIAELLAAPWLPWGIAMAATLLGLIALVGWRRAVGRGPRASRRRQKTARRGEVEAEALLAAEGFEVLERQAEQRWRLWVDGEAREVIARADLLVTREGRTYVADVKTGSQAPDPALPATRRQMLEYLLAFRADAVLVIDMEVGTVHQLDFLELF